MRTLLFAVLLFSFSTVFSQLNHAAGTFSMDCDGVVFDDGGPGGNYTNSNTNIMVINLPPYAIATTIKFVSFDMGASGNDTLIIYHTAAAPGNLIGKYWGNTVPADVIVPYGVVVLEMKSNASANFSGFELAFSGRFDGFNFGSIGQSDVTCDPEDNGSIIFSPPVSGTPPFLYSIDSTSTWNTINAFYGLAAGAYDDIFIKDNKGCLDTIGVVTINDSSVPFSYDVETVTNISCFGLTNGSIAVTLSGSYGGNYDFSWSTGFDEENVTNSSVTGLSQGSYSLTVSDALDTTCRQTTTYSISTPSLLSETHFILDTISCNNKCDGSIAFTAAGGTPPYQYSGNNGVSFQSSSVLDSLCAGTVNYVIQDANGCLVNGAQILTEPSALTVGTTGTDPSGAGTNDGFVNSTPSGGTTPYTYLWNTGPVQTTQNATGLGGGTYTVTVTDSNGCTAQSTAILFEPSVFDGGVIEFAAGSNFYELICFGGTTSSIQNRTLASGGAGGFGYKWQWSTNLSTWNTFVTPTTTDYGPYTPTQDVFIRRMVIDANTDTAYSNSVTINFVEQVFPSITGIDTTYCQNDDYVSMSGIPTSGTSYFTINGYDTTTTTLSYNPTDTILQDTSTNVDTNWVSYTYVDNNGCTFTSPPFEFYIYDTVYFDFEFFQSEYIIGEDNVYLPGKVSPLPIGGTGYFTGPGASGDSLYLDVAGLGGNKSYRYTYTDSTGCVSTDTDSINIVSAGAISGLGDALFCNNEGLVPISATDPNGGVAQPWTPGTPNYPAAGLTYLSGFRLFDAQNNNISATTLAGGGNLFCCTVNDYDTIYLSALPITPGQFLDTFKLRYKYQNKIQNGIYLDQQCFSVPFIGTICLPYFYPTYTTKNYYVDRYFYVEHLNSAGNFSNLAPPYCANIGPVNIVVENQDPLGGISE